MAEKSSVDRAEISIDLDRACVDFNRLLVEADREAAWENPTRGTRWNNEQLLFHMVFGYMVVQRLRILVKVFARLPDRVSRVFANLLNRSPTSMSRTRGTISWTQRSPTVNRPGGGHSSLVRLAGQRSDWTTGCVTVVLGGAQPADRRCAQISLKHCGTSYLAKHWIESITRGGGETLCGVLVPEKFWVSRSRKAVFQRRTSRGRAGRVFWHRLHPSGGALDNSTLSAWWWPSDHRWIRLLNGLRRSAGAGTVQVTSHVDVADTDGGGAVCATDIRRRR